MNTPNTKEYEEKLNQIMQLVARKISELQEAGMLMESGELIKQNKFYTFGLARVIPPDWRELDQATDPEWKEYQRLKEKFKDYEAT